MDLTTSHVVDDPATQVVTIGNAYEAAFADPEPLSEVSELLRADEPHLAQKAMHWATPHGHPEVVVCRSPLRSMSPPSPATVICPPPETTSICCDLLAHPACRQALLAALDPGRAVHLAAYIVTEHLARVARWLRAEGFTLVGWSEATVGLTAALTSKAVAQRDLYDAEPALRGLRPQAIVVDNAADLDEEVAAFAHAHGLRHLVVKSALGAGGEGVFFVDVETLAPEPLVATFGACGYNAARVEAPFVVEERIETIACPTVDVHVVPGGGSFLCGAYEQRLYDNRYFAGFHMLPAHERQAVGWYRAVIDGAAMLASVLADRGYKGPLNVDFLVSPRHEVRVAEINVRRSALLDGIGRAQRLRPGDAVEVSVADYVETDLVGSSAEVEQVVADVDGVSVLLDGGYDSSYRWVSLLAVGPGPTEPQLAEAVRQLSSAATGGVELDIGDVRPWR